MLRAVPGMAELFFDHCHKSSSFANLCRRSLLENVMEVFTDRMFELKRERKHRNSKRVKELIQMVCVAVCTRDS